MVYYKPDIGADAETALNREAITIGRNIRKLRIQKGMSATNLAERTGIRKSTISNYENARSVPRSEILKKIAEILETSVDAIKNTELRVLKSETDDYFDGRIPYFDDVSMYMKPDSVPEAVFPQIEGFTDSKSFLVRINTADFEDLNIQPGSYVLFKQNAPFAPGKILAVNIAGEAFLARIEEMGEKEMRLRVYGDKEIAAIIVSQTDDTVLGTAVLHTVMI